jgi:hypothetical protein
MLHHAQSMDKGPSTSPESTAPATN